ncbi:LacI family DNA-binding transcriptional regulator [Bacillus songklensis]|uniref:LacI family DNA-binding transcriptional regulator n=1 Tax=Bacillus songklensis TaxID=1069116 RepID=A0ABV8B0V9_9BACI
MSVTIKDVAKLANVAPSTVSRVIANSPRISERTKKRVREAMEYLGYHPNFNARSLANKNTQAIGLVMPSSADKAFQNPFFPEVIRGISTKAHEKNFAIYMSTGQTEQEIYDGVVAMIHGRRVDGILLLYSRVGDRIISLLQEKKFPFSVIGKPSKGAEQITHVDNDNFKAGMEATDYLIQLGHERIAFVGGSLDLVVTIDRMLGYKKALGDADILYRDDYIVQEEFLKEGGREAIMGLMSLQTPPTALIVTDDLMSFGIMGSIDEMGLSVPEDISIVSFNNLMLGEFAKPPLTSIDIDIFKLGYQAAGCLLDQIENSDQEAKRVIVPHKLIKRQTCQRL